MRGYLLKDGRRSGRWVRRWVDFNESSGVIFTCKSPDDGERPKLLASLLDGATISMVDKAGKPCIAIVPGDGQPRYLAAAAGEQPPLHSWFHRMQSAIMRHHEGPGPSHNATRAPARERREPQRGQAPGRPTPLLRARHSVEATTAVTLRNTEKAEIIRDDTQDLAEESSLFNTRAHRAAEHLQHGSSGYLWRYVRSEHDILGLVFSSPFDDLSREHRSWLLAINIAVLLGLSCLIVRFAAPFRAEFAQCSEWMGNSTAVAGLSPSPCGGDCCLSTFLDCQECTRDAKACGGNSFPSSGDSSDVCTIYRCTAYVEECSGAGVFGSLLASEQSRHITQIVLIVLILAPLKSLSKLAFAAAPLPWRGEYPTRQAMLFAWLRWAAAVGGAALTVIIAISVLAAGVEEETRTQGMGPLASVLLNTASAFLIGLVTDIPKLVFIYAVVRRRCMSRPDPREVALDKAEAAAANALNERRYARAARKDPSAPDPFGRVRRPSGEGGSTTAYTSLDG